MGRKILFSCLLTLFSVTVCGQLSIPDSLTALFYKQLMIYPQEKIYLHTDKPYYISGEKIWFRAHIADAITHVPFLISQYVYVELINPVNSVLTRVKIRRENDAYNGYLLIPVDTPEGDYTLRAYTTFMRSQDEHYLYTKTVHIAVPQDRTVHTETQSDAETLDMPYRQFIQAPVPNDDFDVDFFPEGGSLMQGVSCKVAFKAMSSDGKSTDITGVICDQSGTKIQEIKSDYLGMGRFFQLAEKGKTYYAICKNGKGQSKRFELPAAIEYGYALSVSQTKSGIVVSLLQPEKAAQNDKLYLIAHIRGMIYLAIAWDHEKSIVIRKDQCPSGVMHLILFDGNLNPVSERLLFINNNDEAKVTCLPDTTRYASRSLVKKKIILTDIKGRPLSGNFSVSVTSDREVRPDSTSNILTQLLLTSDLYGSVENPAYYFQNTPESIWALDLLMLTQGWRRYNIAGLAHARFSQPAFPIEKGTVISGSVKSLLRGKPVEDADVSIWSNNGKYFESASTDKNGRFYFQGDFPDSTRFTVSTAHQSGMTETELILNGETFPDRTLQAVPSETINTEQLEKYVDKAERKYIYEHGSRVYQLPEATVTAVQKPRRNSQLFVYQPPPRSNTITAKDIEDFPASDVRTLLARIPGVIVVDKCIIIRGGVPIVVVDDFQTDFAGLDFIDVNDIEQIDVVKVAGSIPVFGAPRLTPEESEEVAPFLYSRQLGISAIMIYRKKGITNSATTKIYHTKSVMPLGYQTPVEFYAPKYDTPEKRRSQIPDLRTTIYWQPLVKIDSQGTASFEFYTDDEPGSCTTVIEGIADNGTIIHYKE